jgi:hypothetical protein
MKKLYAGICASFLFVQFSYAQTNTFPENGSVGVGTTSPLGILDVRGQGVFANSDFTTTVGTGLLINRGAYSGNTYTALNSYINGVTSAGNLIFQTNGGNVGIGTTSPGAIFQVNNAATTNGVHSLFLAPSLADNNYTYVQVGQGSTVGKSGLLLFNLGTSGASYADSFASLMNYGDPVGAGVNVQKGGNIGIGTVAPLSLFQVDDGCSKASIGDASGTGLNYGTSYLGFNASRSGTSWLTNSDGGNNGGGVMYSTIFGDLYFANVPSTGGSSGQTLTDANVKGNINFRIDHDGITYAKKMIIELTGWPDYVFRPTYRLRPLSEVKAYIDQNHHLPEMPSDKEVEAKGLDVSEMNKLLTKKVEELTLYLIELKQENQEIKKTIRSIKSKIHTKGNNKKI